jgi:hypothetical protein
VPRFRGRNELRYRIETDLYQIIVYDAGLSIRGRESAIREWRELV